MGLAAIRGRGAVQSVTIVCCLKVDWCHAHAGRATLQDVAYVEQSPGFREERRPLTFSLTEFFLDVEVMRT
jgi:hypothetical protein